MICRDGQVPVISRQAHSDGADPRSNWDVKQQVKVHLNRSCCRAVQWQSSSPVLLQHYQGSSWAEMEPVGRGEGEGSPVGGLVGPVRLNAVRAL